MEVATRRIHFAGCSLSSDEAWMMQIRRNLTDTVDGFLNGKQCVLMDRDGKYGIYMWPDAPSIQGHDALRAWFKNRFSKVDVSLESTSEEIEVFGDRAFERGSFVATIRSKTIDKVETVRGKYLNILKRQPDGSLKISHRIRNRDHPVGQM